MKIYSTFLLLVVVLLNALFIKVSGSREKKGSCLSLNLNYTGCCKDTTSQTCVSHYCYCDSSCYLYDDCCYDIASISCFPASVNTITLITPTSISSQTTSTAIGPSPTATQG